MKHSELAKKLLELVGGPENIEESRHCMTRLRFVLKDKTKAQDDEIKKVEGVLGTGTNAGQYQIIVGNEVASIYEEVAKILGTEEKPAAKEEKNEVKRKNIIEKFVELVSTIFFPITYPIAGCGLVSGVLALLTSQNWISTDSGTYFVLNLIASAIFYFLPAMIAFSAAKYFKSNGYIALAAVAVLLHPSFESLVAEGTNKIQFLGMPIHVMSYSYSIIPIILMVWVSSIIEKLLKKYMPKALDMVLTPLITLLIIVPLTLGVIGPAAIMISEWIGQAFTFLFDKQLLIGGILMGAFYPWLVIAGVHLAFIPIQVDMLAKTGITMILPFMAVANTAQAGAAFAVMLKTKNKAFKSVAASASFSAIIGITEPALYGISVRLKRPLYAATISSLVGSIIFIIFRVSSKGLALSPLGGLPLFFGNTFIPFLIGIASTFVLSVILTYFLGFEDVKTTD